MIQHLSFLAALICIALLGGCGSEPEHGDGDLDIADVPQWRVIREVGPADKQRMALQCGRPWRVRFRVSKGGSEDSEGAWRTLALGQSVRIWYAVDSALEESFETDRPSPEEAEAGRTEPHAALLRFQFHDRRGAVQRMVFWSRPGNGRLQHLLAVAPGTYEPVRPAGTSRSGRISMELATIAMTDLAEGTAELKYGETRNRLSRTGARAEDDRVQIIRLYLDLEPVGREGSD